MVTSRSPPSERTRYDMGAGAVVSSAWEGAPSRAAASASSSATTATPSAPSTARATPRRGPWVSSEKMTAPP